MKFARLTSRVVAGGATAALAAAALVGATGTPALAAPVGTTYTCATPLGSFPVPVTVDIGLPPTAPAGFPIPAGLLSFASTATIPGSVQTQLDNAGVTGGKSTDFGAVFGDTVATSPVAWAKPAAADSNGNWVYSGKGANAAFLLPKAGTYTVTMPKTFTLAATKADGSTALTATCTNPAPTTIGTITLAKQNSVVKLKAVKKLKHGAVESAKIKVTNDNSKTGGVVPTGKVTIKDGSKTVGKGTLKDGKVTIKVKALSVGTHNLVVKYGGDDFDNKSKSKTVKVTVTN